MKNDIIKHLNKLSHTVIFINDEYFLVISVDFVPEGIIVKGKNITKLLADPSYLQGQSSLDFLNSLNTKLDNFSVERTQYSRDTKYIWYQQ